MVTFDNISKTYAKELFSPKHTAIENLSFSLAQGKTLGLIGANGAGKSTGIRLLMDFIRPDSGSIKIFNKSPLNFSLRKDIGYLPETANFPANLNILNLLRFTAATCKISVKDLKQRSEKWLKELELWEARKRPLRTYSKGMQQRANFILALINDPELLILDEPMSGLDPMGRDKIIRLVMQMKEEGKTILFCSHILDDVDKVVDDILLLHKGKKLFYGTPQELAELEGKKTMAEAFVSIVDKEDQHG